MGRLRPTFVSQEVFSPGCIEIVVSGSLGGERWDIGLDWSIARRLRDADDPLGWNADGVPRARIWIQYERIGDVDIPSLMRGLAKLLWEHREASEADVVQDVIKAMRKNRIRMPRILEEALSTLLRLFDREERRPVIAVRHEHEHEWFPWEFLPMRLPDNTFSMLGMEFPISRQRFSVVNPDESQNMDDRVHPSPASKQGLHVALVGQAAVKDPPPPCIAELKEALQGTAVTCLAKAPFTENEDSGDCFCWYVMIEDIEELESGFELSKVDLADGFIRKALNEKLVIMAACEAALPVLAKQEARVVTTLTRRRIDTKVELQESAQRHGLAEGLFLAGSNCVVAPLCKLTLEAACSYVSSLITQILVDYMPVEIIVHRLRRISGHFGVPGFAFVCYGSYHRSDTCSGILDCPRVSVVAGDHGVL